MAAPFILGVPRLPSCLLWNMLDLEMLTSFGEKLRTDILKDTDGESMTRVTLATVTVLIESLKCQLVLNRNRQQLLFHACK